MSRVKRRHILFKRILFLFCANVLFSCTDFSQQEIHKTSSLIPARRGHALSGTGFVAVARKKSKRLREQFIYEQAIKGNVPKFLRQLKRIKLRTKLKNGKWLSGTIRVARDYFSIGHDGNFIRIPMNPKTAQRIANHFGYMLPTTKLVDDIYRSADVKLAPRPLPWGPHMTTVDYFAKHDRIVNGQLKKMKAMKLIAGHKKDIVITNRLKRRPRQVAIYGWHRKNGKAIQPLSLVHDDEYADYSHGVRFVEKVMQVGGKTYRVADVLRHPTWNKLISYEGAISRPRLNVKIDRNMQGRKFSLLSDFFNFGNGDK